MSAFHNAHVYNVLFDHVVTKFTLTNTLKTSPTKVAWFCERPQMLSVSRTGMSFPTKVAKKNYLLSRSPLKILLKKRLFYSKKFPPPALLPLNNMFKKEFLLKAIYFSYILFHFKGINFLFYPLRNLFAPENVLFQIISEAF